MATMPADHSSPPPPLRLTIDRAALAANWRVLDRLSGKARAGAAVKADGYGIGARRAVEVLAREGCEDFFVAHSREAEDLLGLVPAARIAVLHGPSDAADAEWMRQAGVRPVINSLHQAGLWQAAQGGECHLMVDTGMNRLGLEAGQLGDPVLAGLKIDALMSHLADAEEDSKLNLLQRVRWKSALGRLPHARASLANSAGIMLGAGFHGDLTRPGLALYGGVPCPALAARIAPVVRPEAALIQVRTIAAGDPVGYNSTFVSPCSMRVGVIAVGYADGYLRCWSNRGAARGPGGEHLPVLGRVSMDLTIVDLSAAPALKEGDWLSIDYDLPASAQATGLSQYELLTLLGRRFGR